MTYSLDGQKCGFCHFLISFLLIMELWPIPLNSGQFLCLILLNLEELASGIDQFKIRTFGYLSGMNNAGKQK